MIVKCRTFIEQVIRADDRRVAARVAAADPALLEHGDVGQAMLLGQVIRRSEPVATAADDDRIVGWLRLRLAPLRLPAKLARQAAANQGQRRKSLPAHARRSLFSGS